MHTHSNIMTTSQPIEPNTTTDAYPYYKNIRTPSEIGMSDKGSLSVLGKDINGLMSYVEILVSGKGSASKTNQPLGNKFFVHTKASCTDVKTNTTVPRSFYVSNVPMGNIPLISSGMGEDFTEFRGILPGIISDLNAFNPMNLVSSFSESSAPECQSLTMETIDTTNKKGYETNYVTLSDIKEIDSCLFSDGKNPVTGETCSSGIYKDNIAPPPDYSLNTSSKQHLRRQANRTNTQGFANIGDSMLGETNTESSIVPVIPNDIFAQTFMTTAGMLAIYILYKCAKPG